MSYRFMRLMVFFDLPVVTLDQQRQYRAFRKLLSHNGFVMLQQSVYSKILLNATAALAAQEVIRNNKPPQGSIAMLLVTEKQFERMEFVLGEIDQTTISTDQRLVIL